MSDEIRYTTRHDGPTRSRARLDTGTRAMLVVPAASLTAASPEVRNRVAALSRLPIEVVADLAAHGEPVIVHRSANLGEGRHIQERLQQREGLPTQLVDADGAALPGASLAAGALGALLLSVGGGLWLFLGLTLAPLVAFFGLAAIGLAVWLGRASREAGALVRMALEGEGRAQSAMRGKEEPLAALAELRESSFAPDLPVEAQVDLWRALEALEHGVLDGSIDGSTLQSHVETAREALAGHQGGEGTALAALSRTTRAIAKARVDTR